MKNGTVDDISKILMSLSKITEDAFERAAEGLAKDGAEKLRKESPKKTGEYAKGWTTTKMDRDYYIRNRKKPGLTHLLEKGHAKRGGGEVAPIRHIEPVEEWVSKELAKRIEEEIKNGS